MTAITSTNHHSFTVYLSGDLRVRLRITQFASDEFGDLYITSDMGVILSRDEAQELINELQEVI